VSGGASGDEALHGDAPGAASWHGDVVRPGSLKVVVITDAIDAPAIAAVLVDRTGAADVRALGATAWCLHTGADAADVRDWLAPLATGGSVFVAEFESWAGHGDAVDRTWLLRRGH
jgi:hypothetical protein